MTASVGSVTWPGRTPGAPRQVGWLTRIALVGALIGSASCTMGPDYVRPDTPSPAAFRAEAELGNSIANIPWWELYEDPALRDLIEAGLADNRSLRQALGKIAETRASLGIVEADLYPNVISIGTGFYQTTSAPDSAGTFDNVKLAVSASYEIDLWGRIARTNEAALQSLLATEEAYRTVTIGLVSEIAGAYLVLRDLDARFGIAQATVASRTESLDLLRARAEGGLVPAIAVNRAEIDLADAEAIVQKLVRARAQTENALSLLAGRLPSDVERGRTLEEQTIPPEVPAGLPSELLQRRPDVLTAERALHAQTALIGVAEAARFPSLSLTGSTGAKSSTLGQLTATTGFLNLGASLVGSIFNAGRNKARVQVERARAEQALNQYEQVVLNAFREVEDALVAVETYRVEHEARVRQVGAAHEALEVAEISYEEGLISYMEVLDFQEATFGTELLVSEALQARHSAVVRLYKVLGGGWSPPNEG